MTGKVELTRKQADAIEYFKNKLGDERIIMLHAEMLLDSEHEQIDQQENLDGISLLTLVDALRIGYEVEPQYKVGDWIVFENAVNVSLVCAIENVGNSSVDTDYVGSNGCKQSFNKNRIRHATPEEIKSEKESRLWAKIGREVGEFKEQDTGFDYDGILVPGITALTQVYSKGELQGFFPAESFISFEECDSNA